MGFAKVCAAGARTWHGSYNASTPTPENFLTPTGRIGYQTRKDEKSRSRGRTINYGGIAQCNEYRLHTIISRFLPRPKIRLNKPTLIYCIENCGVCSVGECRISLSSLIVRLECHIYGRLFRPNNVLSNCVTKLRHLRSRSNRNSASQ